MAQNNTSMKKWLIPTLILIALGGFLTKYFAEQEPQSPPAGIQSSGR